MYVAIIRYILGQNSVQVLLPGDFSITKYVGSQVVFPSSRLDSAWLWVNKSLLASLFSSLKYWYLPMPSGAWEDALVNIDVLFCLSEVCC